jgi:hypothetical protein
MNGQPIPDEMHESALQDLAAYIGRPSAQALRASLRIGVDRGVRLRRKPWAGSYWKTRSSAANTFRETEVALGSQHVQLLKCVRTASADTS